uniref:Transposase n=1 Tax=Candidatus Kentrum sp. FW TaxID=2126338 RepID=A0A450TNH3_9GAMM|nr:MAG: Putative transposase [Candidatus Kentron sp. FW]
MPAITGVLHTFGSDLKRHVHIHFIVSAGGLKLSGKAERFTRYIKRKAKNRRVKKRKVTVLVDKPGWVQWSFFPHKMLQKRYQSFLIEHLKERVRKELRSDVPDPELMVFSEPSTMKGFFDDLKREYKNGFFVHVSEERKELLMTIGYIGRYARRPPLSEVRIKDYTGEWITFEYKDYRNSGGKVSHTLKTIDFIRRLIRHIPPHCFNVIRHFGQSSKKAVQGNYRPRLGIAT